MFVNAERPAESGRVRRGGEWELLCWEGGVGMASDYVDGDREAQLMSRGALSLPIEEDCSVQSQRLACSLSRVKFYYRQSPVRAPPSPHSPPSLRAALQQAAEPSIIGKQKHAIGCS